MRRDLSRFEEGTFDLFIIGGGISGAAIAWEATLRGYRVALAEKNDFGHATSSATSKMIHGGLRYLAQGDFRVVRESLRERRLLEQNLPSQAFPLPFLFPIYKGNPTPGWKLNLGLYLYDTLSFDRNDLEDPDKHLPGFRWLSAEKTLEVEPTLSREGLRGAFYYYDILNRHPERSNFDFIDSAERKGAVVANHLKVTGLLSEGSGNTAKVTGATALDEITGQSIKIKAQVVVNASGPWGEEILKDMGFASPRKIIRSKGIHLVFPRVHGSSALAIETKDKRHLFVLPWLNHTLIGTTDTPYTGDLDQTGVTESEAQEFINQINENLPFHLQLSQVQYAYAGIRPLVSTGENSTYAISRKHEIIDHAQKQKVRGLVSVFGGKWTTSRSLAEATINLIEKRYRWSHRKSISALTPLLSGNFQGNYRDFIEKALREHSQFAPEIIRHLIDYYGAKYSEVLPYLEAEEDRKPLIENLSTLRGEIRYAVEHEMSLGLDDFILRRSGMGQEKFLTESELKAIADLLQSELNWTQEQKEREVNHLAGRMKLQSSP